jgi:hypothetical protein
MTLARDERGAYLTLGFDRVDAVREALQAAGISFDEEPPEGCAGPVYAVLRFPDPVDLQALEQALEACGASSSPPKSGPG